MTSLVFVLPTGYLCFVDVFSIYDGVIITVKTILFLVVYILYDEYINEYLDEVVLVKGSICLNQSLWVLVVDVIALPFVSLLQIAFILNRIFDRRTRLPEYNEPPKSTPLPPPPSPVHVKQYQNRHSVARSPPIRSFKVTGGSQLQTVNSSEEEIKKRLLAFQNKRQTQQQTNKLE